MEGESGGASQPEFFFVCNPFGGGGETLLHFLSGNIQIINILP